MIEYMFFVINLLVLSKVFNYIDPGTGSAILAMAASAIIGAGVALKMYWEKLKYKLSSHNRKN